MRLLLIHQNFPGQFREISPELCNLGHELKAISNNNRPCDSRIEVFKYEINNVEPQGVHQLTTEVDSWIRRGEAVAKIVEKLKQKNWIPDVILAHPGWGEALFVKSILPQCPLVIWPELWLRDEHINGVSQQQISLEQSCYLSSKNWLTGKALNDSSLAILPTNYQASTFPLEWHKKILVLHEGIDDNLFKQVRLNRLQIGENIILSPDKKVITFISRNLEPMRGFPEFMRIAPKLQALDSSIHILVVGGDEVSYSNKGPNDRPWREVMMEELRTKLDPKRIDFVGRLPHQELIKIYRRSDVHVYLSKPFVLSWSVIEILACGTPIVAYDQTMMREVLQNGENKLIGNIAELPLAIQGVLLKKKEHKTTPEQRIDLNLKYSIGNCSKTLEKTIRCIAKTHY
jgi:glycosyltransferase involved in cell wall biosynthesis